MQTTLRSEISERSPPGVNDPSHKSDPLSGHIAGTEAPEGFTGSDTDKDGEKSLAKNYPGDCEMTVVTSVGSAVENSGNYFKSKPKSVTFCSSVGVEPKENFPSFEGKEDSKYRDNDEDEFLTVGPEESNGLFSIGDDGKHHSKSTEGTYTGVFSGNGSDNRDVESGNSSLEGSDTENHDSYSQEGAQSRSSQVAAKHRGQQDWLVQNPDSEAFCRGDGSGEYLHEHEGDIDDSAELWVDMKKHDSRYIDVDLHIRVDEDGGVDYADLSGGSEADSLSGDNLQVRGTGRPDLDDSEYDFGMAEEGLDVQLLRKKFLDGGRNCGSGRPDLEEDDGYVDDKVAQKGYLQGTSNIASRMGETSLREDVDDIASELSEQIDEHDQDDLQSGTTKISSQRGDGKVAIERMSAQHGRISDETETLQGNRLQLVQLPEMSTIESSLGTNFEASGEDKEIGLRVVNAPNLMPEKILKGSPQVPEQRDEDCEQVDASVVMDGARKRGRIIRLGSKEAEELLQMDVAKMGRVLSTHLEPSSERPPVPTSGTAGADWAAEDLGPDELSRYVEALEVKETYIDTVLDMEDILFDAEEGSGARILQGGKIMSPRGDRPARDGTTSASTSSEPATTLRQLPANLNEVEWVEVIGALQRRGGASLGDRVVGVKEHTVYRLKVSGGGYEWEIYRRYRDFVALHNQLLQLFTHKGTIHLPTPWEMVNAESRKFFGNTSPGVVEVRSALIQVCLQSLLKSGPPLSTATPLLRFLFPDKGGNHSLEAAQQRPGNSSRDGQSGVHALSNGFTDSQQASPLSDPVSSKTEEDQDSRGQTSVFGKTIRLIVQTHKKKSLKQQLQAQHFTCAGCYKHLELAHGLLPEIVQNWGWSGLRFCDYSGQIFCSTCHLNETAVIPARVLQRWDFTPRYVSQLAKAYLDSIYDKPMLCVSAVNPYLYVRVPVLAFLTDLRRNVSKMLACISCPARARIQAMMGSRRYLLESNDFFALRDLVDLSKGAFSGYMQAILVKLSIHITRECPSCRELGEACAAKELCDDPFDIIYPYQEKGITRCQICHSPYHERCFLKCKKCCLWRKVQACLVVKEPPGESDVSYPLLNAESDPRICLPPPMGVEIEDFNIGSLDTSQKRHPKPKRRLLTNLLRSDEIQPFESQREQRNSSTVNTSDDSLEL